MQSDVTILRPSVEYFVECHNHRGLLMIVPVVNDKVLVNFTPIDETFFHPEGFLFLINNTGLWRWTSPNTLQQIHRTIYGSHVGSSIIERNLVFDLVEGNVGGRPRAKIIDAYMRSERLPGIESGHQGNGNRRTRCCCQ